MCPNCRAFITTDDRVCPYCQVPVGPRVVDRRSPSDALGGLIPADRMITTTILAINFALYLAMILRDAQGGNGGVSMDPSGRALVDFGGKFAPLIAQGQWWRLLTAGFLHGGILHILMNSWVLFDLGATIDNAFGRYRYLVIYFVSTITGFLASLYMTSALSIGASAGISGLIGAMVALGTKEKHSIAGAMRGQYIQWMMIVLVQGFIISGIDNAAHIGGFIGGFIVAYIAGSPNYSRSDEGIWKTLAYVCLAITGYAFFDMFQFLLSGGSIRFL